ncbi:hypothetical protein BOS5A_211207 [Bosea sp. EC-HK365B]|nr:hypothetical protein BOS5A_211207 [Bosea sp. EC-HK365B]
MELSRISGGLGNPSGHAPASDLLVMKAAQSLVDPAAARGGALDRGPALLETADLMKAY